MKDLGFLFLGWTHIPTANLSSRAKSEEEDGRCLPLLRAFMLIHGHCPFWDGKTTDLVKDTLPYDVSLANAL